MSQSASTSGSVLRMLRAGCLIWLTLIATASAEDGKGKADEPPQKVAPKKDELSPAPAKVDVQPIARDEQIRQRLQDVLIATEWFNDPQVKVVNGVVFLNGRTDSDDLKKWAGDLSRNTQDVVAVANSIDVTAPSVWDFSIAWNGMFGVWRDTIRSLPLFVFGLCILVISAVVGWLTSKIAQVVMRRRVRARLLRNVFASGLGFLVFLVGTYVVLRVSGLTQLALTIVGGTGLVGLAVGIAFRDITENFLASVFLSMQRPFDSGDLIEVAMVTGYVQQLNIRTTVIMTLDGNLVQIPNATIYKSTLRNFTTNSNRRESFVVGIGYAASIDEAQEVARKVLTDHPAVLADPEPLVLADALDSATVNLRIYFWFNGHEHSSQKVRSSVIRLIKQAFQQRGIPMADTTREIVISRSIPVTSLDRSGPEIQADPPTTVPRTASEPEKIETVSTKAEAGLSSEAGALKKQAREAQPLGDEENLLRTSPSNGGRN